MKTFFGPVLFALVMAYLAHVLVSPVACERVERSTLPVRVIGNFALAAARPWATEATLLRIRLYALRGQLAMANFIQRQFYFQPAIRCPWNDHEPA